MLTVGEQIDLDELSGWFIDHGYKRVEVVELPGEFGRRGGIFDLYSPDADAPYRLELTWTKSSSRLHGDDRSLFGGFEKLAQTWQHLDPEINEDKLKRFLEDEKALRID